MSSWTLAWRTVARNPTRAVLAVAGVAVIGALLFDMLLLSRGLMVSFRDLLDSTGVDVRVMARAGSVIHRERITGASALATAIEALPSVESVTLLQTGGADAQRVDSTERTSVELMSVSDRGVEQGWNIVRGTDLPPDQLTGEPPLIVSSGLASALGLEPGSQLVLRTFSVRSAAVVPPITGRVVGIGEFVFGSADDRAVVTTRRGFAEVYGKVEDDTAEVVLVSSRAGASAAAAAQAIAALRPDLRVMTNEQVLDQFNENAFSYFRQISTVLSTLTLVFTLLLVSTLLTMSVNQRLGEVAALRAIGFRRRRIVSNLLWESALLVGAGGLAALPIGGALAVGLDRILRQMPEVPAQLHFFVLEPQTVLLHLALLAATGLLAAVYPIWIATRLPIAATLRREIVS